MIAVGPFQCRIFYDSVINTYIHTQYTYIAVMYIAYYTLCKICLCTIYVYFMFQRETINDCLSIFKRLEHKHNCKKQLRELVLFNLEKRRVTGNFIILYNCLK